MKAKNKPARSKPAAPKKKTVKRKKKNDDRLFYKKDYEPGEDYYYDKSDGTYVKKSEIGKDALDYDDEDNKR